MGKLLDALTPPSSYGAKKTGLWDEIQAAIERCVTADQLRDCEAWLNARELEIPAGWWSPIKDRLTLKGEEIASEDIGQILRDRFDF